MSLLVAFFRQRGVNFSLFRIFYQHLILMCLQRRPIVLDPHEATKHILAGQKGSQAQETKETLHANDIYDYCT